MAEFHRRARGIVVLHRCLLNPEVIRRRSGRANPGAFVIRAAPDGHSASNMSGIARSAREDFCPNCSIVGAFGSRRPPRDLCAVVAHRCVVTPDLRDTQTPSRTDRNRSSVIKEGLNKNRCYGDLCFGVFALSVEIRPSAAGGTCVS